MNKKMLIITGAGLVVGLAEALIYYNKGKQEKGEKFSYKLPPAKELGETFVIVAITSLLTAGITEGIEYLMDKGKRSKLIALKS